MIELHHVAIAVSLVALCCFVGGLIIGRIYFDKDVKQYWNNPRNNDDFLNIPPQTNNRKHKNLN